MEEQPKKRGGHRPGSGRKPGEKSTIIQFRASEILVEDARNLFDKRELGTRFRTWLRRLVKIKKQEIADKNIVK